MNEGFIQALVYNASLLLALALLFDLVAIRLPIAKINIWQIPLGVVIGGIGITVMQTPWILTPGIIFDTRSIILGISGLFFGLIPTLIGMLMTAAFRIYQGGAATIMGVAVIISSGTIGLLWRHSLKKKISKISLKELYGFGIIIHLAMLVMALLLPWQTTMKILSNISVPVLVIYPIVTALLGLLMVNRIRREQSSDALAESEELLRLAVEAGSIGFFSKDLLTNDCIVSPEWKKQLGYANNEITTDNLEWKNRLHPDDETFAIEMVNASIQGKDSSYEIEYRLQHRDGSYRWILEKGLVHRGHNGKAIRVVGTHVDITKQKEAAESMQKSESRFRGLAESSQDFIMLYDHEGRHVYMNSAGLKVSGFTEEDIIGKTHREAGFGEELSKNWENDINNVFSTGQPSQRLFDWESIKGKVFLDWRLTPVHGPTGEIDLVLGISRDITSMKIAEIQLQKSREQYRVLTETIKDVVWIVDVDTMLIQYISPSIERLLGYSVEEISSFSFIDTITQTEQPNMVQLIQTRKEAFIDGEIPADQFFTDEVPQVHKDGSIVWTEVITNYYRNDENGHIKVRGVSRDISERKLAKEKMSGVQSELIRALKESDQSRRSLLSVAEDQKRTDEALRKSSEDLVYAYDATLLGWSTALEMRERETAGHSLRVVQRTLELANALGIDQQEMTHIQRGALLHDIGKMGIPDSILLKPGPLTDDEWVVMRQHPSYAYRLLSNIPYLAPALEIPFFHHERWDGSGYPQGLIGENIPFKARIFAVVDVWDALSSDRPYRPAWGEGAVNKYLRDQAGKQFDPKVVEVFLRLFSK
jgi:PAS domain S-box-containing protein